MPDTDETAADDPGTPIHDQLLAEARARTEALLRPKLGERIALRFNAARRAERLARINAEATAELNPSMLYDLRQQNEKLA
jgi:hypothetical protein